MRKAFILFFFLMNVLVFFLQHSSYAQDSRAEKKKQETEEKIHKEAFQRSSCKKATTRILRSLSFSYDTTKTYADMAYHAVLNVLHGKRQDLPSKKMIDPNLKDLSQENQENQERIQEFQESPPSQETTLLSYIPSYFGSYKEQAYLFVQDGVLELTLHLNRYMTRPFEDEVMPVSFDYISLKKKVCKFREHLRDFYMLIDFFSYALSPYWSTESFRPSMMASSSFSSFAFLTIKNVQDVLKKADKDFGKYKDFISFVEKKKYRNFLSRKKHLKKLDEHFQDVLRLQRDLKVISVFLIPPRQEIVGDKSGLKMTFWEGILPKKDASLAENIFLAYMGPLHGLLEDLNLLRESRKIKEKIDLSHKIKKRMRLLRILTTNLFTMVLWPKKEIQSMFFDEEKRIEKILKKNDKKRFLKDLGDGNKKTLREIKHATKDLVKSLGDLEFQKLETQLHLLSEELESILRTFPFKGEFSL